MGEGDTCSVQMMFCLNFVVKVEFRELKNRMDVVWDVVEFSKRFSFSNMVLLLNSTWM